LKQLKPLEANYQYKYGGVLGMKAKESNKFKALGMISEIKESFEKAISLKQAGLREVRKVLSASVIHTKSLLEVRSNYIFITIFMAPVLTCLVEKIVFRQREEIKTFFSP
jgi:hypothetical protein